MSNIIILDDILDRIKHCANPIYPDAFAYTRIRASRVKKTWKGHRRQAWYNRYGQWVQDNDFHRGAGS